MSVWTKASDYDVTQARHCATVISSYTTLHWNSTEGKRRGDEEIARKVNLFLEAPVF